MTLPCQGCRGLCCGPVPVTEQEITAIRKKVKTMPAKQKQELQSQLRFPGTCIFFDQTNDRCGIHSVRPQVCRDFGYYQDMVCFRKPEAATKVRSGYALRHKAILSVDLTWADFK
ncbi:YkgJ family cysteine cluster protein [Paenibacillus gansuensis]|uniref:YkgJ family cysteine cluster protein n=1 Tax=Paenibacillus gansuensis TaxID=306542 RepID=A0ABW5PIK6_9BACL